MGSEFRIKVAVFDGGERFPLLLGEDGVPHWFSTLYVTTQVRDASKAPNTMRERIVELLDGWQDKLTWEALCAACGSVLKTEPSRQTLYRYSRVKNAFKQTKERLKHIEPKVKLPPSMRVAAERIARLERENARLKRENSELLEQFVVWQDNAHVHGLSNKDLSRSLPSIDRGITE